MTSDEKMRGHCSAFEEGTVLFLLGKKRRRERGRGGAMAGAVAG